MRTGGILHRGTFQRRFSGTPDDARNHFPGWTGMVWRHVVLLVWLFILLPAALWGQVRLGLERGHEALTGASAPRPDAPAGTASVRPYRPTWWGLRLEGPWRRVRPALTVRRGTPDLALVGAELTLIEHAQLTTLTALQAEMVVPLFQQAGVEWRASVGSLLERWAFRGTPPRWRGGPMAGVSLIVPVVGPVEATLGGSVGILPMSPFTAGELPETLEPRGAWRTALRGGVNLRFE